MHHFHWQKNAQEQNQLSHLLARLKQLKKSIVERRIVKLDHELCKNCSIKLHKEFGIKGWGHSIKPQKKRKGHKMTHAEKIKFLARLNKGRRKKGLKPIHAKR